MFKLSRHDLPAKSDAELAALFNRACDAQARAANTSADFAAASALIPLLRAELARRNLTP